MVTRPCDHCGTPYEAQRATSRYCPLHIKGKKRRGAPVASMVSRVVPVLPVSVLESTRSALDAAGVTTTPDGAAALNLAALIDDPPQGTHSSVAAWVRAHRESLAAALAVSSVSVSKSTLDEVRARRDAKRHA